MAAAMASSSIRLRRTIRALSALHHSFSATSASPCFAPISRAGSSAPPSSHSPRVLVQFRAFRSSSISLLAARSPSTNDLDEIGPDTILFEGCDYNHWLIVMDFPKGEEKPPPEKMIETYEQTCSKGLNISVEEAKKKMYACSTTTYTGFQAVMTEEESKKFEGLAGVIFVLPDSYIDPANKEYGGDKYINGTIIPRPPPIQYGRNQARRDRNRNPGQYNRQENPMSKPQWNASYNNQGSMQGDGRNYGASQNYPPQQNHGQASPNYPPQLNHGQASPNYPPQQNHGQASQSYPPQQNHGQASPNHPPQQNYGQALPNYPPQQNYSQASQNYPSQQNYGQASQNYPPRPTYGSASQQRYGPSSPQYAPQQSFGPPGQGERSNSVPTHGGSNASQVYRKGFEQAGSPVNVPQQNFGPPGRGDYTFKPSYIEDFKPSNMEEFDQAGQRKYFAKDQMGNLTGDNRNVDFAQNGNYSGYGDGQRFTLGEQKNAQGVQRSDGPIGLTGT